MATESHDPSVDLSLANRPVELLQTLIRFDTTNPPGNERSCVEWIEAMLAEGGFETETYARDPDRPNLVARLSGGDAPPLMLYGHVDVVPTADQEWTHPPFEAVIDDGFVWGRGALDMKGGVAMMLAAALRVARTDHPLAGDLRVVILADEEAGGDNGAAYLVDEHPGVFDGVEYAIGEFGGFSMTLAGQRLYPIQVNEKVVCWSKLTFTGPAGHGSLGSQGGAMVDMARAIEAIDATRLPTHVIPAVEEMVMTMADELGDEMGDSLRAMVDPDQTDAVLDEFDDHAEMFDALLHNTAAPTVVRGGDKENVIPGRVELTLDCRLLPGQTAEDLEDELRTVIPADIEFAYEPIRYEPFPAETDLGMFDLLASVIEEGDPEGTPVPLVLPASTDARQLARAGVQSYGFTPMTLPPDFDFLAMTHVADERIPVDAVEFGASRLVEVLDRYDESSIAHGE